ncbi:glutaminase family protein [Acidipila rosea]|uniref:Uncharacterized protein DUF4964 n=1 Tax=Acidipila rosea TaxID=768535 RepID=A0A4R1KZE3_9BACT|nr:glutaminase family protein [Acidipila rosea]TCK70874.1 uncharacterized protein DUF4964 [Acidipila rosea]
MRSIARSAVVSIAVLIAGGGSALHAQQERPPAVPLIAHDPYFSIWSMTDHLTDGPTRHWTGERQPLTGLIRIDGKLYRYMGGDRHSATPAMQQTALKVSATHTDYEFSAAGIKLQLTFFAPAFPQDLDLLSRPVTYVSWKLSSTDGKSHQTSVFLDVDPVIAVDQDNQKVTWGRSNDGELRVLNVGSRDQQVLNRSGDNLRIDWGYFHLAVPQNEQAMLVNAAAARQSFEKTGTLPTADDMDMPQTPRDGAAHLALEFPAQEISAAPVTKHALLSYTAGFQIQYLGRNMRPYWQRNNETVEAMLAEAEAQYSELDQRGRDYDAKLTTDLTKAGGADYAALALLAYRQTIAAHGLVADIDGTPMLFAKEDFSNGDIATVDVLYPSAPFFLFFNPKLLEAQLKPVLEYASLARWKFPFAPHDLGRYPLANGQEYGGGEKTEENQMPVEESGNLLICAAALGQTEGNWHVAQQYWPQLSQWAAYLREKGLDPENQLSTDDFAGHLAHNANLSIKAIDALAAYAEMAKALGHADVARGYAAAARDMAAKWQQMAIDGDHYKLAFDKPGTWSQKYNLVWDQLLGLNLFPAKVRETEVSFYLNHMNQYGVPLDSRADYTKLDWELWSATLGTQQQFTQWMGPIYKWINETPTRVPLTDWYDTKNGKQIGFQARSVVGGVYVKALSDAELAKKWRAMSK